MIKIEVLLDDGQTFVDETARDENHVLEIVNEIMFGGYAVPGINSRGEITRTFYQPYRIQKVTVTNVIGDFRGGEPNGTGDSD